MAHIELQLLSHIIRNSVLDEALRLGVVDDYFVTDEGRSTWQYMTMMKRDPRFAGAQPGENLTRTIFPSFDLCDDASMTLEAYCAMTRDNRLAIEIQSVARELAAGSGDPMGAATKGLERLQRNVLAMANDRVTVSAADMAVEPPDDEDGDLLVPALGIGPGAYTLLAGPGNIGKSTLAMSLALAIAAGEKWLGRFEVRQGRVLHADADVLGRRIIGDSYRKLARGMGIDLAGLGTALEVCDQLPPVGAAWEALAHGRALILVDSLAALPRRGVNENDTEMRTEVLDVLGRVSARTGCTFLILHHTVRRPSEDAWFRGASAIFDAAGAAFSLTADGDRRVLEHKKKRGIGTKFHEPVSISEQKLGEKAYALMAQGGTSAPRAKKDDEACQRVIATLSAAGGHVTTGAALQKAAALGKSRYLGAIKSLQVEGRISREGRGFRLTSKSAASSLRVIK